jgi:hypothetical protein
MLVLSMLSLDRVAYICTLHSCRNSARARVACTLKIRVSVSLLLLRTCNIPARSILVRRTVSKDTSKRILGPSPPSSDTGARSDLRDRNSEIIIDEEGAAQLQSHRIAERSIAYYGMDSPASSSSGAPRRHLKRLSLSVSPRHDLRTQAIAVNAGAGAGEEGNSPATATPDRRFNALGNGSLSAGPLSRSAGPGCSSAGRRARPTSMYASTSGSALSPFNNAGFSSPATATIDSESSSPLSRTALPALPEDGDAPGQQESFSPTSSLSRATGSGFNGRRSLLGRSPHTRGQSSISYARSSGSDSGPSTPRSSVILNKGENTSSAASNGIQPLSTR